MKSIFFQDNQTHSTYSDGTCTLKEIFEYNNLHDKLDLTISDHVRKETKWYPKFVAEIKTLRKQYPDFTVHIGCEVKILDDGTLNTTRKILDAAEIVIGSVHHFDRIKEMPAGELLEREFELTKLLAQNTDIDVLGHPFSMAVRFHNADVPRHYIEEVYGLCVKNGIKFEYNHKNSPESVRAFVREKVAAGDIKHLSFGSDMHTDLREIGQSSFAVQPLVTVLLTGAGTAITQGVLKGLRRSPVRMRIIAADMSPLAAGLYAVDKAYLVPPSNNKRFIPQLIKICKKERVDIIFPGLDPELEILSKNAKRIKEASGTTVAISNLRAVRIADDKWKTVQFLKENRFPYAKSCLTKDVQEFLETARFPLIVKPRIGARSIGLHVVKNKVELDAAITETPDAIIQEYLSSDNDEYTCSAFVYKGKCYGVICGQRWLRNGDTYKAHFKKYPELEVFIAKVAIKLNVSGPCNFQLRQTVRGPVIFEINCRFSGTTGAINHLGFNVANALLQIIGLKRTPWQLSFKPAYVFRYWNELFVKEEDVEKLGKVGVLEKPGSETNVI